MKAVSKAQVISEGFEQRHEGDGIHFHTLLSVGLSLAGFVSIIMSSTEFEKRTRNAAGYLTLTPEQAKSLALKLNEAADSAEKDLVDPELHVTELSDSILS
jgi:hypothetical protein